MKRDLLPCGDSLNPHGSHAGKEVESFILVLHHSGVSSAVFPGWLAMNRIGTWVTKIKLAFPHMGCQRCKHWLNIILHLFSN